MLILWRYLANNFIYSFLFSLFTFIAVLLIIRLEEIAHFAALSPSLKLIAKYTLYQIPYIIPITIPLSCLIASVLLFQKLSQNQELTALRASGFSLASILFPITVIGLLCSFLNFYVVSEVATECHLSANILKNELRTVNPLLILQNKHLMRAKGYFFDSLGNSKIGESASNIILAAPSNGKDSRMNLLISKNLISKTENFLSNKLTVISDFSKKFKNPNQLLIENINTSLITLEDYAKIIDKKSWSFKNDHLRLSLLLTRLFEEKKKNEITSTFTNINLNRCLNELFLRFSAGFLPFTFTLMGSILAINIQRTHSNYKLYSIIALACFYLICFFSAKGMDQNWLIAASFFFIPHLLIITISLSHLKKISVGKC